MKMDWFKCWTGKKGSTTVGVALYDWGLPGHLSVNGKIDLRDSDFSICITVLCFYCEVVWYRLDLADRMVETLKK